MAGGIAWLQSVLLAMAVSFLGCFGAVLRSLVGRGCVLTATNAAGAKWRSRRRTKSPQAVRSWGTNSLDELTNHIKGRQGVRTRRAAGRCKQKRCSFDVQCAGSASKYGWVHVQYEGTDRHARA
jgi:hypothetical protein